MGESPRTRASVAAPEFAAQTTKTNSQGVVKLMAATRFVSRVPASQGGIPWRDVRGPNQGLRVGQSAPQPCFSNVGFLVAGAVVLVHPGSLRAGWQSGWAVHMPLASSIAATAARRQFLLGDFPSIGPTWWPETATPTSFRGIRTPCWVASHLSSRQSTAPQQEDRGKETDRRTGARQSSRRHATNIWPICQGGPTRAHPRPQLLGGCPT